jgi:Ca2+-binding RTX toxin-like protein
MPGSRSLDYQVTDDTGLTSNLATATFDVTSEFLGSSHGDLLSGGNGPESFFGMGGDDTISGGGGDDRLLGGAGNDSLTGGGGADSFQFSLHGSALPGANDGADRIAAFDYANDILTFTDVADVNGGSVDLSDLQAQTHVTDDGTNVTVSFDNGASIVFEGMGTAGHTIADVSQLVDSTAAQIQVSG